MSNAFEEIKSGLEEAIAWQQGDKSKEMAHFIRALPVNVKEIRAKLGITQEAFCENYGISLSTLKKWETGAREPEGPTKAYLYLISQRPNVVKKTLRSSYEDHLGQQVAG
jgi:putative transcriptional regulator